nr:hypothetical protein [Baekduia soli]
MGDPPGGRRAGIPALTTLSAGLSAARAIASGRQGVAAVLSLQELHLARSQAAAGTGS